MRKKNELCAFFMPIIIGTLIFGILIIVVLTTTNNKAEWQGPNSGLWYCKDLQMQICCQPNAAINSNSVEHIDTRSYVLTDERVVMCELALDKGDNRLVVINQDLLTDTGLGDVLFDGEFVSLDIKNYVVKNKLGTLFIFQRIEEFALDELQKDCLEQINSYDGIKTVSSTQHIETAIQAAKSLWLTELGIDAADKAVEIFYDFEFDCWFISIVDTHELNALIGRNGQVISVWKQ